MNRRRIITLSTFLLSSVVSPLFAMDPPNISNNFPTAEEGPSKSRTTEKKKKRQQAKQEVVEQAEDLMAARIFENPTEEQTEPTQVTTPIAPRAANTEIIEQTPPSITSYLYYCMTGTKLDYVLRYYLAGTSVSQNKLKKIIESVDGALEEAIISLPKNHGARMSDHKAKFEAAKSALPADLDYKPLDQTTQLLEKINSIQVEKGTQKIEPTPLQLERLYQELNQIDQKENQYVQETLSQLETLKKKTLEISQKNRSCRKKSLRLIKKALPHKSEELGNVSEDDEDLEELRAKLMSMKFVE